MYNEKLKKILYFIPNYILIILNLIYYPLDSMYMKSMRDANDIAPFHVHNNLGMIIGFLAIICIILRIIFNAKRCNIESKTYKIINNVLTILLLIVLWAITSVA